MAMVKATDRAEAGDRGDGAALTVPRPNCIELQLSVGPHSLRLWVTQLLNPCRLPRTSATSGAPNGPRATLNTTPTSVPSFP
jgi:hypothetical protein